MERLATSWLGPVVLSRSNPQWGSMKMELVTLTMGILSVMRKGQSHHSVAPEWELAEIPVTCLC
jgi:hypothetical protein